MNTFKQMSDFAKCVWLDYGYGDIIEMRALDRESGKVVRAWNTPSWYIDNLDKLKRLNVKYDIYAGINPRIQVGKGSAAGVMFARCLFAEFDDCTLAEASSRVDAAGLPCPTAIVWSGGGPHLYWRLDEPCLDMGTWILMQKRLILALGSDKTICDAPRIMRLPGFFNHKPGRSSAMLIAAFPSRRYSMEGFKAVLPDFPVPKPVPIRRAQKTSGASYSARALAHECKRVECAPPGTRHNKLFLAAFRMGQLVAGGYLSEHVVLEDLCYATGIWSGECQRDHITKTIKDGMAAGKLKPRSLNIESRG